MGDGQIPEKDKMSQAIPEREAGEATMHEYSNRQTCTLGDVDTFKLHRSLWDSEPTQLALCSYVCALTHCTIYECVSNYENFCFP